MLERPESGQYICTKLCDYQLKLYGTADYLKRNAPIKTVADLRNHAFVSYVADLAFSHELLYLSRIVPGATANLCSTSVIAQYHAALQGNALAILPCFMAEPERSLMSVLSDEVVVIRHFWLCCREDLRRLRRITVLWDYLRAAADKNQSLLMGDSQEMKYIEF